jgi:NAD(P)-dependent dehydrogenase (short-subunit alcohol dehydrogenase family)
MKPDLTAIVTGGSRGIGLAIATALVGRGARVTISGRDRTELTRTADAAGARDRILPVQADIRRPEDAQRLVEETVSAFGGLDLLVNNAGVGMFGEVAEQSVADWNAVIDTNLTGVFHCCRAAIPHLRRRGGGWIINISSLAGVNPFAGAAAYCASKAALNAFSEALMQELRYDDIRVSYLLPGSVRTGFGGNSEGAGTDWKLSADDVAQVVVDLLEHPARSLPSRVDLRPAKPRKR